MKSKNRILIIFLFFSLSIILFSCRVPKAEWKGTIEEVDGVTVITNPVEPLFGELVFDLEEDLSIGREDDDRYMFFRIGDIKVDSDGNIYVFEQGNMRVQKFDQNGNFLCTIGREGQGPGEFQRPIELLVDDKRGIIGINEMRKVLVFDMDGIYLDKDIFFETWFYPLTIDKNGALWGIHYELGGEDEATAEEFKALIKLNNKGQIAEKLARFPYEHYRERMDSGAVLSITTDEEHDLSFSLLGEQNIVYGFSKEYELNIIDLDGNLHTRIKKDDPYQNFTAKERGKYKRVKLPEYKPFFYSLLTDSEDRIYAQRTSGRRTESVEKTFDVFSKDGYYLYKIVCTLTPWIIKDGFFYTRIVNEDTGEVFVKRYKIKNWDKIKTGV